MTVSELSFNESFSRTPGGVTEKFQPLGGGIDPGTSGALSERASFTPSEWNDINIACITPVFQIAESAFCKKNLLMNIQVSGSVT